MHHIVPALDRRSTDLRELFSKHGIHPNSAFNGIGLRQDVHRRIHRDDYFDVVEMALSNASNSRDMQSILEQIARRFDQINLTYAGQVLTDAQLDQIVQDAIEDIRNIVP